MKKIMSLLVICALVLTNAGFAFAAKGKADLKDIMPKPEDLDPVQYTLGPDDIIEIEVRRHPEFSGEYPINLEGKIQYKFVGDIEVSGLTKDGLKEKLEGILSEFVKEPDINITILEYLSKVIYVIGEVAKPGKYFMRADSIPVREAVVAAGLPTPASAMRKSRLITPAKEGKDTFKYVDLFKVLYEGDLTKNLEMQPGDVLYVPATVMSKVMRVLIPVTSVIGGSAGAANSAASMGTVGR